MGDVVSLVEKAQENDRPGGGREDGRENAQGGVQPRGLPRADAAGEKAGLDAEHHGHDARHERHAAARRRRQQMARTEAIIKSMTEAGAPQTRPPQRQPPQAHRRRRRREDRRGQSAAEAVPADAEDDEDDEGRRNLYRAVCAFYAYCLAEKWIMQNPMETVNAPTAAKFSPKILTIDEAQKLLDHVAEKHIDMLGFRGPRPVLRHPRARAVSYAYL
jgi:hypothetical protein